MNKLYSIILLAIVTLNCSCGSQCDQIDGFPKLHRIIAQSYIADSLKKSIRILDDTFSLTNQKSFKVFYRIMDSVKSSDVIELNEFPSYEHYTCGTQTTVPCYGIESFERILKSNDIGITISYGVSKSNTLPRSATSANDTALARLITDVKYLTINGYYFSLSSPNEILDSVTIISKTYKNVIHTFFSSDYLSRHTNLIPAGVYFQDGKGIVGYYLSNGEKWER